MADIKCIWRVSHLLFASRCDVTNHLTETISSEHHRRHHGGLRVTEPEQSSLHLRHYNANTSLAHSVKSPSQRQTKPAKLLILNFVNLTFC